MSDTKSEALGLLSQALAEILRPIVEEAVQNAVKANHEQDRLLDVEEASQVLGVGKDWLYRRADRLPFVRKLAPRVLRFSYQGIQKWLATRKSH